MDSRFAEQLPQKELTLKFSGRTEPSVRHPERNEDAIGFDSKNGWAVLLDGVGGSLAGELASKTALEFITQELSRSQPPRNPTESEYESKQLLRDANQEVLRRVPGSQTTIVLVRVFESMFGKIATIGSVGDSRAYLFRDGKLERVTVDNSLTHFDGKDEISEKLDTVVNEDELTEEEAAYFEKRNVVTQVLGGDETLGHYVYQKMLRAGDKLILTTDGVHDNLTTREIEELVASGGDIVDNLIKAAKTRSSENHFRSKADDISAVVVEVT